MRWVLLFIFVIACGLWLKRDRRLNPEKWRAADARREAVNKRKAEREYEEAMTRVPPSEWMRMSRHEKANVLERREKAAKKRSEFG